MCKVVVAFIVLLLPTSKISVRGADCYPNWFDCGNGKCISEIWYCDGENDCGNFNDERDCAGKTEGEMNCLSSQFKCEFDDHCIPEKWLCDGQADCVDGSDEKHCENVTSCTGFRCRDNYCIPPKWYCDGSKDCPDGSDEELCAEGKLCMESEFLCSSGSCVDQSFVCNGKKDCADGSDEGPHCDDPCKNMTCSQNCKISPLGPRCFCNEGFELDAKDNKTCNDIDECKQEGFCSHKCVNTNGSYECVCQSGYELVNRTCIATGSDPLLIFSTIQEVRGMWLRSNRYYLVRRAFSRASAVDVDPKTEQIYWIEISNKSTIYSAKIDGRDFKTILNHGLLVPEDIAVDYIASNLYLTDSGLKQVLACKMDGTICHVLHDTNVDRPRSLVLDPDEGLMYWSDWGEQSAGIYRSGMDGSLRISLVSKGIGWPNGIALDHSTNRLYWADAKLSTIEFITLDGKSRKVILNTPVFHPYSLTVFEDSVYWSDWQTFSLESCNKFTGHKVTIMARENGRHIMGVHVYHPVLMAKVANPCWTNDCSHMCLIAPENRFTCACPHGFRLEADFKTCILESQGSSIFVSEGSNVFYIRPKSVGSETLTKLPLSLGDALITRIAFDSRLRYLFIADVRKPAIYAVNMTSQHIQELARNRITSPTDLAFDWRSNNLYWIDSDKKTAEVVNVNLLRSVILLKDLTTPVAIAISPPVGQMFIATIGINTAVTMYEMDGKNKRVLNSVRGMPISLALHPSKSILYWADPQAGTISYVDYAGSSTSRVVKRGIDGVMSLAASEEYIYWTDKRRELNMLTSNMTYVLQLPGQETSANRTVIYSPEIEAGLSRCLFGNGGCSYICLTSPAGRTCACSSDMLLSSDNVTCKAKECDVKDFKCMSGLCLRSDQRCDGNTDCEDGSDEVGCITKTCSDKEFQCESDESCIDENLRCDGNANCVDKSDEKNCEIPNFDCPPDEVLCPSSEKCISRRWICDGDVDCPGGSDEKNCSVSSTYAPTLSPTTKANMGCPPEKRLCPLSQKCISRSWICNGVVDCPDGSDEKNCNVSSTHPQTLPPIPKGNKDSELVFYNEGPSVFMKERNGGLESVNLLPLSLPLTPLITGLSYDVKSRNLFVADKNRPAIYSIDVPNLHVRTLVRRRLTSPNDIAFDWMSNNLYWVDSSKGTTEVISVDTLIRKVILEDLPRPVSIVISPYRGIMFIATIGNEASVSMYAMDGKNKTILHSVRGLPMSLALHPSKTILYWADPRAGIIAYTNYSSSSQPWILKSGINGIMSVASSEDTVYWTAQEVFPNVSERVHESKFAEHKNVTVWKKIAYSHGIKPSGKSECLIENGGCSYLCLTSPNGRSCTCSPAMTLADDGKNCLGKKCESDDFKCANGQCIPAKMECDGSIDCIDGSDELICDSWL